ncbi:MAG: DUF4157 domain-containing protein [Tildeniella torsiva UHER 1998/13D]|jgi:hypothetical protein|nr:DUF4157 domain-containing protein [Tildeniella torsiva UHER 1998/13D]
MESAPAVKTEAAPKSAHRATKAGVETAGGQLDGGTPSGMPLFLQRSITDQRQSEEAEDVDETEVKSLEKEPLGEAAVVQTKLLSPSSPSSIQRECTDCATEGDQDPSEEDPLEPVASRDADALETIQPKLIVNEPGDVYEQEADRVAQAVAHPALAPNSKQRVQRQPTASPSAPPPSGLATADAGRPLSPQVRQQIEPALGSDLGHVRVHAQPADRAIASSLQAKAFTHDRHIWLGEHQNPDDLHLMAHEATHVVQQSADGGRVQRIQRKLSDNQHPEDIAEPRRRMEQRIQDAQQAAEENPPEVDEENAPTDINDIDRSEISQQKGILSPDAALVVNRPAEEAPQIEQAGNEAQSEVEAPAEPITNVENAAAGAAAGDGGGDGEGEAQASATQAAGLADQIFTQAGSQTVNTSPPAMTLLQPAAPVDAAGQPLPANTAADAQMVGLIDQAQVLRDQGQALRQGAAEQKGNALTIRGNIMLAKGSMNEVDTNLERVQGDLEYRREVLGQANEALTVSEQKAETVATQVPEYQARADEGKADSEPMTSEVSGVSAETAANTPDDDEAVTKTREQGQDVDRVNQDTQATDATFGQTQAKATSLSQEAEAAKATNEQTQEKLTSVDTTLAETDGRLAELAAQNAATRAHFDGLAQQPNSLISQADTLDQNGQSLIQASVDLEAQIHQAQADYETGMAAVPASTAPPEAEGGTPTLIQRTPERINLGIDEWAQRHVSATGLGSVLTGYEPIDEERRQQQYAEHERRRAAQIQEISDRYGANLERASMWDKAMIGSSLALDNLLNSAATAEWPRFFGHLLQGFVDPRIGLQGIVSGLNMTLSGVANATNLITGEDRTWENAIKSTAEIVTGITYILGSITLAATAIAVILTAIAIIGSLFSFGAAAAALAPFISFFWGVVTTVGGWTLTWAKFALLFQFIAGLKDLIDAAAASTATELQGQSEQMSEDATQMAGMVAIIGLAKLGEVGGRTALGQRAMNGVNGFLGARGIPSPFKPAPPQDLAPPPEVAPRPGETTPTAPRPTEPTPAEATAPRPTETTPAEPTTPRSAEPTPAEPTTPRPGEPTPAEPTTPRPAEPTPAEPTAPGGKQTERVPGLYEGIDPAVHPNGYTFVDRISPSPGTVVPPGTEIVVNTTVTAPDGTSGSMSRGLNTSTGEFIYHYAFLDSIPRPLRWVRSEPAMVPNRGTPLETYMTMRQMKLLQERAGVPSGSGLPFSTPRTVHLSTIINVKTVAQLAAAERAGVALNEGILNTHSVQYANNSIVQGGGQIATARVSGGYRTAASNELTPAALQEYGIPPDFEVLTGFDIDLTVVPAGTPVPAGATTPVRPVIPPPQETDSDD